MRHFALILTCAALAHSAPGQSCTPGATQTAAARVATLRARLIATTVPADDSQIPDPLKPVLHDFKQALAETVDLALRCNNPEPALVQSDLAALLHTKPWPRGNVAPVANSLAKTDTGTYGGYLEADFKPMPDQPGLFAVQLSYAIECGADDILLVYRRDAQGYHRVLLWQNPDLNTIGDAMGDQFFFTLVPGPMPAMAVIYGSPWCSSNMSMLHVDLLALAAGAAPQRQLDHIDHDYRRDGDVKVRSLAQGFEIRATVDSVSGDLILAPAVLRYSTMAGKLVQQPVALNARSFVDLWLGSDWKTVSGWGDPASTAQLQKSHDELHGDFVPEVNFGAVLACSSGTNHYQLELDLQADHTTADLQIINLPSKYAQIRQNKDSFTLLSITDKPDPTCKGPDILKGR